MHPRPRFCNFCTRTADDGPCADCLAFEHPIPNRPSGPTRYDSLGRPLAVAFEPYLD